MFGADFFLAVKTHRGGKKRLGEIADITARACPVCFCEMPREVRERLRRTRAAVCPNMLCQRPLVWVADVGRATLTAAENAIPC